jgi:hypothetical protein
MTESLSFLAGENRRLEAKEAEEFRGETEREDGEETEKNRGQKVSPRGGFRREKAGAALSSMVLKKQRKTEQIQGISRARGNEKCEGVW